MRQVTSTRPRLAQTGARAGVTFLPTWLEVAMSANEELRARGGKKLVKVDELPAQLKKIEGLSDRLSALRTQLKAQSPSA